MDRLLGALALVLVLSACGRIGFDALAGDGDANVPVDAGPGDATDDLDAALCASSDGLGENCADGIDNDCDHLIDEVDPDCDSSACLVVTTAIDESDPGESAAPPHLGLGLSLREGIALANGIDGPDCIVFGEPMTISLLTALPAIVGTGGLRITGGESVVLENLDLVTVGLAINSNGNAILGVKLRGFTESGIDVRQDENRIGPGVEVEACGEGIQVLGERCTIVGSWLHHNLDHGIQLSPGTIDAQVIQNVLYANVESGLQTMSIQKLLFAHNTVYGNKIGLDAKFATIGLTVLNNLFVGNTQAGVDGTDGNFSQLDFNGYFNLGPDCIGCTAGAQSVFSDPALGDPIAGDFSLRVGSSAIDVGTETGIDSNGPAAGLFNGLAPDLGAIESP